MKQLNLFKKPKGKSLNPTPAQEADMIIEGDIEKVNRILAKYDTKIPLNDFKSQEGVKQYKSDYVRLWQPMTHLLSNSKFKNSKEVRV